MDNFVPGKSELTQKKLKSQKSQRISIEVSAAAHNYSHPKSKVVPDLKETEKTKKGKAKG